MKRLLLLLALLPLTALAEQRTVMEYGRAATVEFELYAADGTLSIAEADGGTEVTVVCDGDAGTTATNDFVDEGFAYSLVLTAAELECAHTTLNVGATLNHAIIIETCGSPNAQHMLCSGGLTISGGTSAVADNTTTVTELTDDNWADDDLNGFLICMVEDQTSGDPRECQPITDYNGTTEDATHVAFNVAMPNGGEYIILPDPRSVLNSTAGVVEAKMMSTDTGAITDLSIAADAIGASELAADAATEITDDWETQSQADSSGFHVAGAVHSAGTCDSGTTTTCVDAAAFTTADADYFAKGFAIQFTSGTLDGQSACIYDFDPATDTVTFRPALTQAVSTHTYILVAHTICGGVVAP